MSDLDFIFGALAQVFVLVAAFGAAALLLV